MQKKPHRSGKIPYAEPQEPPLGRQLPSNVQAERSVLAGLLLNDDSFPLISEVLVSHDFYTPAHQTIYAVIQQLVATRKRVDLVTIQDQLVKEGTLESVGGIEYLIDLQEDLPSLALIEQHAHIVKEKAILRELIGGATRILGSCYNQKEKPLEEILDTAEKEVFDITKKRTSQHFVQIDIWLKKTFQHLSTIKSHSKGITGIPSGFKKLDSMTSGFQNGDLVVLAARPSMGKTALALCMSEYAAYQGGVVGFFSLEMSAEQLTLRLLSTESGIGHHNIRNATISSQEWVELTNVAARMAELKLFIDDTPMLALMDLRAKARKLKAEHNVQMLVVDYLQLLHTNQRHENRHQEVSEISRSLKALAKELEVPIIALSQLSRAVDGRTDKRPMLSDLRESGAIEQDADLIMFLYRDVVYNPETEYPGQAELIIGKQRNGPTGTVYLNFVRELTKFENGDEE